MRLWWKKFVAGFDDDAISGLIAFIILAIALLFHQTAHAQTTTVTGTVTDPNGVPYASGSIMPVFVSPGGPTPKFTATGQFYSPPSTPTRLDSTGSFTIQIADNTFLFPASTKWNFTVCSGAGTVQPAGGRGSVCFGLVAPITISGASQSITANLNAVALPLSNPTGPPLNALSTCNLRGDGVTDDAPAFQACINARPGRHFILPKIAGSPASTDYFFGSAITFNGNGQIIEGEAGGYVGGVTVLFPAGTKGFIFNNATCQGCTLANLNIPGSSPFTGSSQSQCVIPSTMEGANGTVTGTSTDDAVQVGADFTRLQNLYITGWGRHGVYFTGGDIGGTFADDASIINVIAYGNRGDGFYGHGGDFNAGVFINAIAYFNQFWGIHDSGFLGNTWVQPQVTGNHQDNSGAAGSTTPVNISRSGSVVTVANFTAHGLVVGNAIVISGASDATYNGTWFVASVIDANTITFSNGAGTTSGVTANARIATCTEAWTASGLDGGSYKAVGVAQVGTWVNPYAELSNGGSAKFAGHNMVVNGNLTFDTSQQNYHYTESGFHGNSYSFSANDANHPNVQMLFQPIQTAGSTIWSFIDGVGGTEDYRLTASPGSWQLADQRAGGAGFRLFNGGIAQVDGGGGSVRLNSFSGAGVQFGNGAGVFPFTVNQNGGLAFNSLFLSPVAPTISSGFGTSPSIATSNGTAAFTVNVGTGGTATSGVIGLPTAANGWNCVATDITTNSATVFLTKQTASSTTSCTIGNFNTSGAAAAWAASDIISVNAFAR